MRRTLAALVLAMALPPSGLLAPAAQAQAVVVVKAGETLSEIAERHGVSLSRLMQANGITDPDLVVIGQRLTMPGGSSRATGSARGGAGSVTVQAGDTLSDIAARHGVGLSRLMQANGITDPDLVVIGQRLTIPSGSGGSAAAPARSQQPTAPYTVKSGETLSEIAARFDTSTERLIQLNGIQNPDHVMSGTRLRIPMSANRKASTPARAPAKPSTPDRNAREHVVQGGESLSVIAERYGTTVNQLVALNSLDDPDHLLAGSRLKLRGTPPAPQSKPAPAPKAAATPTAQPAATPTPQPEAKPAPQPAAAQPERRPAEQPTAQAAAAPAAEPRPEPKPTPQTKPQAAATGQDTSVAQPTERKSQPAAPTRSAAAAAKAAAPASAPEPKPSSAPATAAKATPAPASAAVRQASVRTGTTSVSRIGAATGGVTASRASAPRPTSRTVKPTAAAAATSGASTTPSSSASSVAARPAAASTPSGSGDWRPYGPLQIDWSQWQPMGGSFVAPSLNSEGKARYMAVNCTAGKLNTTTPAGQWNSWLSPEKDFEKKLVEDICKEKGG